MPATTKATWATIDATNPAERDALRAQEAAEARERVRAAVAELKRAGLVDAHGRRVRTGLPPEMRDDSDSDLSAL